MGCCAEPARLILHMHAFMTSAHIDCLILLILICDQQDRDGLQMQAVYVER
jgi:hypothetical protein